MTELMTILKLMAAMLPFLLLALLVRAVNLKKEKRSRQFPMPILAPILCIVGMVFLTQITKSVLDLIGRLQVLADQYVPFLGSFLKRVDLTYVCFFVTNCLLLLAYLIVKGILIAIFGKAFKTGNGLYEMAVHPFYEYRATENQWFVRERNAQLRGLLKALYVCALLVSCALMVFSAAIHKWGFANAPAFYPAFAVILVGELFFFMDGLTAEEWRHKVHAEEDTAEKRINYMRMRDVLRKLFPDKLIAESTRGEKIREEEPIGEQIDRLLADEDPKVENYGRFMKRRYAARLPIDRNYLYSGKDLLCGKSILFNNPFYRDYIPYLFYPVQHMLLRNKKVLILLGRNAVEDDIKAWAENGLVAVNSTPGLFTVGILKADMETLPDIGILTRSDIHDQHIHEACEPFFDQTEFVIVIEPSKLLTTAQIGLNGIAKRLQKPYARITWCCIDKNCDGLVDALSHALLADLQEVSATTPHSGVSSYMLWETDHERLQHRLLPNISRYLGFGTELSVAALKNQIEKTMWYGGDAFPVNDMHWIATQYYSELLNYAELPATQQTMSERFVVSPNLWNAEKQPTVYLTVEDEDHNMFEMRRAFSTRATKQGFVNILTDDYLLKDYMSENAEIFEADAKAIPNIVADYVRTERNVALRMILMMTGGTVREDHLKKELLLIGHDEDDPIETLWDLFCRSINPIGTPTAKELILTGRRGEPLTFERGVIQSRQKYDIDSGKVYRQYYIEDAAFTRAVVYSLQNADCIVEDEKGETHFLGAELRGHIFQKYLPGQFLTKDGKYYEMLTLTPTGQMLVRRAADHIDGRVSYRQERNYRILAMRDSDQMGASREIEGMKIVQTFADFTVETPAYWQMDKHGDFAHAKRVSINGIPTRTYHNKSMLRIELPDEGMTDEIRYTITTLINEVFRSLFAENQPYLIATMPGAETFGNHPLTYSLTGEDGVELGKNAIYLIEDSELDLGLLVAAQRNLKRIFEIICDYLDWHLDTLERSRTAKPEPEPQDIIVPKKPEENAEEQKKSKNPFVRFWRFLKRIFAAIAAFFRKLFKRKPKAEDGEKAAAAEGEQPEAAAPTPEAQEETPSSEEGTSETAEGDGPETAEGEGPEPEATEGEEPETDGGDEASDELRPLASLSRGSICLMETSAPTEPDEAAEEPEPVTGPTEGEPSGDGAEPEGAGTEPQEGVVAEFEGIEAVEANEIPVRKPYFERYYLLFGGEELPKGIVPEETSEYLKQRGYGDNSLQQARSKRSIAEIIAKQIQNSNGHQCDFCGRPLSGIEYEVLADGRERCTVCGRTAIKSAESFEKLLTSVLSNMKSFYGVEITVPVHVQMVNAKKLHRKLNKTFVPTGNHDGRILGVAIKDRSGYSILVENGAPRIQTMLTLAHELTHIWQYLNWNSKVILAKYTKALELEIYEGMAKWAEIQYAFLIGEEETAKREEIITIQRNDEYGRGFRRYLQAYPLHREGTTTSRTPFGDKNNPL